MGKLQEEEKFWIQRCIFMIIRICQYFIYQNLKKALSNTLVACYIVQARNTVTVQIIQRITTQYLLHSFNCFLPLCLHFFMPLQCVSDLSFFFLKLKYVQVHIFMITLKFTHFNRGNDFLPNINMRYFSLGFRHVTLYTILLKNSLICKLHYNFYIYTREIHISNSMENTNSIKFNIPPSFKGKYKHTSVMISLRTSYSHIFTLQLKQNSQTEKKNNIVRI